MANKELEAHIEVFKQNIADGLADPSLVDLPLEDFIKEVALTPREKKQAQKFLKELKQ
jgi:hypothetical protein